METLWRVVCSMRDAAKSCGVQIITGDTKVVGRSACDKLFLTTTGVGVIPRGVELSIRAARPDWDWAGFLLIQALFGVAAASLFSAGEQALGAAPIRWSGGVVAVMAPGHPRAGGGSVAVPAAVPCRPGSGFPETCPRRLRRGRDALSTARGTRTPRHAAPP